ncbi:mitoguardin 1 isoform X2 [Sarcophilus harrisii]|uniref:mitoguardin 1 isoform X2 n=1 Tax=Sarcophilus harrisii TaxID=9305 RepID=UPI001301BD64|nr:mitoguardin 1 isoform X2 [Sarcophilus harrisii]
MVGRAACGSRAAAPHRGSRGVPDLLVAHRLPPHFPPAARGGVMLEEVVSREPQSLKTTALRVFHLPLAWCRSLIQIRFSPGVKKLFAVTAVSAVSILFLAHHFKRRRGKKKRKGLPWEPGHLALECAKTAASEKGSSCSSSRQNLTLSLSSAKDRGSQSGLCPNGGLFSKCSGSAQSLASVQSANSCHSCACGNSSSWDKTDEEDLKLVNIPVTTPENLYLMGMELFEEALRRWEQALTFRSRQAEDEAGCGAIKLGAGDAIAEESVEDIISAEFIHKLESLLQRAYRLQEEFEATLGASDPSSLADIDRDTDITVRADDLGLRDSLSIASTDSFVSVAELTDHREGRPPYSLDALCRCPLYEEAMHLVEEGKIYSRVLRTEMLECLGDSDFLAKLHCIRQAFQVILSETANRTFLAESGRKILSALIVKARKTDHWESTEGELAARGVKNLNFYDIVLDFILMDSFEDLENPPTSIQNVVNNRWLNSSFKETAVASSCWSVLKQKRQQMKIPDGFFAHFYAICEHVSPVLAWGFLGPRNSLYDLCYFFKDQVLYFLKDIFDLEKVRYSSMETLAEDLMQLLMRRTELLMAYLGTDALRHANSCVSSHGHTVSSGLVEARVQ